METDAPSVPLDDPTTLELRVLNILRAASNLSPGPARREALAEIHGLRRRAIELHRHAAAELKARLVAQHPEARLRRVK